MTNTIETGFVVRPYAPAEQLSFGETKAIDGITADSTPKDFLTKAQELRRSGKHREANALSARAISALHDSADTALLGEAHDGIGASFEVLGETARAQGERKLARQLRNQSNG